MQLYTWNFNLIWYSSVVKDVIHGSHHYYMLATSFSSLYDEKKFNIYLAIFKYAKVVALQDLA